MGKSQKVCRSSVTGRADKPSIRYYAFAESDKGAEKVQRRREKALWSWVAQHAGSFIAGLGTGIGVGFIIGFNSAIAWGINIAHRYGIELPMGVGG